MQHIIKKIFNRFGYNFEINKLEDNSKSSKYISANEIVKKAKGSRLSICDYVEKMWNQIGDTQKVINKMQNLNVYQNAKYICEIGAGTGRYMEKTLSLCDPVRYDSYETAKDWADYLQQTYPIISCTSNGKSLNETKDDSIDLMQAHGVFVYLPFLICMSYFSEILRVVRKNGFVVFDILSEDCMDKETVSKWINSIYTYPCFLSTEYVDNYFTENGFKKIGSFYNNYGEGKSKYLVFKKS